MRSDLREYFLSKAGVYSDEQYIAFLEGNVTALEIKVKNLTASNTQSTAITQIAEQMEQWGHEDVPVDVDLLRSRIADWVRQLRAL